MKSLTFGQDLALFTQAKVMLKELKESLPYNFISI